MANEKTADKATAAALPATISPDEGGFRAQFTKMEAEFQAALPPHMPVDRFMRVVLTAVNGNPDLLRADRRSLFEAAMKAAQDGLLPDGRDGALVIYNTKVPGKAGEKDTWIQKVQWMPMIAGILKRIRNSGELKTIVARVVYAGDKYRCWVDDDGEHVEYEAVEDQDRNIVRRIFAMARLKDDSVEVEELFPADIEKIRAASKSSGGPAWTNWWSEMAKKSALRRLSKRLPISSDLDDLIRRDDELYDFSNKSTDLPPGFEAVKHPLRDPPGAPKLSNDGQVPMETIRDREPVITDNETDASAREPTGGGAAPGSKADNITTGPQARQAPSGGGSPARASDAGAGQNNGQKQAAAPAGGAQKPYDMSADSYMGYMRDEFDRATSIAAVNDLWGATRADRMELLQQDDRLDELTLDKNATISRLKLKNEKGGA